MSLDHPTAKGDGREELVREFLRQRVGSAFGVVKGEIIDSVGKSTGEFDAIIYDQRTAASVTAVGDREAVRVEAAVATVEVKSNLSTDDLKELFAKQNKEILQLNRFYRATSTLRAMGRFTKSWTQTEKIFASGLNPLLHHESIPAVVSFVFAFEGPRKETVADYIQFPFVDVVTVLGKYTVAKPHLGFSANPPGDPMLWAEGEDALGGFLFLVEECLENYLEARDWVAPAWRRYFFSPETLRAEQRAADAESDAGGTPSGSVP